jgi:signal transduction histidine kinase
VTHRIASAALRTRRGLLVFAVIWQAAWMLSDTTLWPINQSNPIEAVLIWGTWVSWLCVVVALVASRRSSIYPRYLSICVRINILLLGASAVTISVLSIDPTINDWIVSASIFNLVAGIAGVSIRNPEQWAWVFGFVLIEFLVFIGFGFSYVGEMQLNSVILYPLYALAIGVAAASGQRGLVVGAERAEQAQALALDREIQALLAQESDKQTANTQARVHETVLNTMTAIARGGLPETPEMNEMISTRCSEAIQVLRDVLEPIPSTFPSTENGLYSAIRDVIAELGSLGIKTSIEGDFGVKIPELPEKAIIGGVREALINVMRHSQANRVVIRVTAPNAHSYQVSIEDDGKGFPHSVDSSTQEGYGWNAILGSDLQAVGATAWMERPADNGCVVHIQYSTQRNWFDSLMRRSPIPTTVLVLPILASWLSFSAVNIALAWNEYSFPLINVITFSLMLLFAFMAIGLSRSGSLPWWMILVGVGVAFVTYQGEQVARGQVVFIGPWSEWSSEAIAAIFLLLAAASTWWAWIVVGIAWMIIQDNFPLELVAPGFTLIMVGGVLGLVLRQSQRSMDSALRSAAQDGVNASMARYQAQVRAERFSHLNAKQAIELLDGIATGRLDRSEREIRHQCAVQEMYVRNIVISGAVSTNSIGIRVAELARDKQVVVEIVLAEPVGSWEKGSWEKGSWEKGSWENEIVILEFLASVFDRMKDTDRARFSILPNATYINLHLVCQFEADPSEWSSSYTNGIGSIEVDQVISGGYTLMWFQQVAINRGAHPSHASLNRGR